MTEKFQIIHLGNPYDFVIKNHATNRTYGTFQGDEKSMREMLNDITEEIKQLNDTIHEITSEFEGYHKSLEEPKDYEKQFEVTSCPYEIRNNKSLDYYWLEHPGNVIGICNVLNEQSEKIKELEKENLHLNYDNKRMVDFIMSKGYGLKDYLDFCKEYKE